MVWLGEVDQDGRHVLHDYVLHTSDPNEHIPPGGACAVTLEFPEAAAAGLSVGQIIQLREGSRVIGCAKIDSSPPR